MADDRVVIFDTTLRDGEQSPGISLDVAEKLEIADQLARLGVDVIEAGFPIASQGDFEAVQAIARSVQGPIVCGLSRTARGDIDRCWEAIEPAARRRVHIFIATSEIHMKHKLRMTPEQVRTEAAGAVAHARQYTDDVEFSPEDASRSDFDFMCEVLQAAVDAGATTLNIPDTVGYAIPEEYAARLRNIREKVAGDYVISTHCHNDLGLAVANSLAAVTAGARQVECTINGIGERAGNAAMEEIVVAIRTRPDFFGVTTGVRTEELARTSRLVSRLTGYPVQFNKAVVGRNAFAHEAGIHQHGVLAERTTYEIIDAATVGQEAAQIVLGKHSGRHAFADTLAKMGLKVQGDALNAAFTRFKELADRKVEITDADLEAIVAEELGSTGPLRAFELESLELRGGTTDTPAARVVLVREGEKIEASAEGDGMIDAACKAIKEATGVDARLTDFNVSSVTGGVDALGDVIIQVEADGTKVSGRGVSTDVVEASARAFLNAVNKIVRVRARTEVRDVEVGP
ncbi:MAG: 2-isopropylmalate synthase [Acidimicrobiales bacterium]